MLRLIIDADVHIRVGLRALAPHVEQPWRQHLEVSPVGTVMPHGLGDQTVAGRIPRPFTARAPETGSSLQVVFPDDLLDLGLHPNPLHEAAVAAGYARWLTEVYLPSHLEAAGMLYLPLGDVEAAVRLVSDFGERPNVVGAFVTGAHFPRVHDNRLVPLYRALEERDLALGFHPSTIWTGRPLGMFDRFLPVWALGQAFNQCIHLINWVLHAMPDRFPGLRCIFYEAGVTWLTFVAHRLDQEFMKRPSEAPLLVERPSHYIRRCFFGTQPLEQLMDPAFLEHPMRLVGVSQLVYASNLPRWDFDLPGVIRQLTFLDDSEREAILGGNAIRLFARAASPALPGVDRAKHRHISAFPD